MFDLISLMPKIPAPSLDLNFVSGETLDNRITFTRNSIATRINSFGVVETVTANTPRFDYDPVTLQSRGLLIEESRTNGIRNNTMVGAVAGTPGTLPTNWSLGTLAGLTTNVIGSGTESGIAYVDLQIVGTPTGTAYTLFFEATGQIAALNAQSWSSSLWCKIVAGSTTNIASVNNSLTFRNSGGSALQSALTAMTLSSTMTRYAQTVTATNATTAFVHSGIWLTLTTGSAINITLRIGLPQLEQGAFATSVIPTSTAAVTRTADVASVNTLTPWYNAAEGTFFAETVRSSAITGISQILGVSDGTSSNRIRLFYTSNIETRSSMISFGVEQDQLIAAISSGLVAKVAYGYVVNNPGFAANGGAVAVDTSAIVPSTVNNMRIGANVPSGDGLLNGYIRRIAYYPQRLNNQSLQILTK